MKERLGRGFTATELKAAGISVYYAPTIGIAFDKKRRNLSQEGVDRNVQRLKEYMSKLIVFSKKTKKDIKSVVQDSGKKVLPLVKKTEEVEYAAVTEEMNKYSARTDFKSQVAYAKSEAMKRCHKYGAEEEK